MTIKRIYTHEDKIAKENSRCQITSKSRKGIEKKSSNNNMLQVQYG
jgi:hypothetical protein